MNHSEIYERIAEVISRVVADMPTRDGEVIFAYRTRVYYSDDMLNETDEYKGKSTSTVWGEISFEARGREITDESLCFSLAVDLDKSGNLLEKYTRMDEELTRFENEVRDTLYTPSELCENADELIELIKARAEEESQKIIDEFEKTTRKIYRKALIIALVALAVIVPLLIFLAGL